MVGEFVNPFAPFGDIHAARDLLISLYQMCFQHAHCISISVSQYDHEAVSLMNVSTALTKESKLWRCSNANFESLLLMTQVFVDLQICMTGHFTWQSLCCACEYQRRRIVKYFLEHRYGIRLFTEYSLTDLGSPGSEGHMDFICWQLRRSFQ